MMSISSPQSRTHRKALANTVISEDEILSTAGSEPTLAIKSSEMSVSSNGMSSGNLVNNSREFTWKSCESEDFSGAFSVASLRSKNRSDEMKIIDGSKRKPQHHQVVAELTINKLKVDSIGLIGREREVSHLKGCFDRLMTADFKDAPNDAPNSSLTSFNSTEFSSALVLNQPKKELVFISGLSGVGKSSVGRTIKKNLDGMEGALYVEGKFDFITSNEPYSGIANALGAICRIIIETRPETIPEVSTGIYHALHDEVGILVALIPNLKEIVASKYKVESFGDRDEVYNFANGKQSLKFAFRVLMRVLTSQLSVLVMMLDDLQWADDSSLEVIDYIITDVHNARPLMILGCYRSDEVHADSLLSQEIQRLHKKKSHFPFSITEIEVNACSVDDVNRIIMAMMTIDDPARTYDLAKLCHQRTLGNPFFLIEFMMMLHTEALIEFNLGLLKWVYDVSKIEDATMSTTNVTDLLEVRIKQFPKEVQLFLQYAACLGSSFSVSTLQLIWDKRIEGKRKESIEPLLASITSHNIVDNVGQGRYRWVHDKVQEAALALTGDEQESFQFSVGALLYHWLSTEELETVLFEVTDLINSIKTRNHFEYAELNLQAAEKARGIFALHSSAEYASIGIGMLPDNTWEARPRLALRLYTIGAEMELALGHGDAAEAYRNTLVGRNEYSIVDKLPLQCAYVRKVSFVDLEYSKAVKICMDLLSQLGVKVLWRRIPESVQALTILMRTISRTKKEAPHPEKVLKEMNLMTDKKDQMIIDLLGTMAYAGKQIRGSMLSVIGICMMVQMTLDRGIAKESGSSFVWLGNFTITLKSDYETAAKFAEIGLAMHKEHKDSKMVSREGACLFSAHAYALSWKLPFHYCLKPLADGYASYLPLSAYSMWALVTRHLWVPYLMGKPLAPMMKELPIIQSQMEELSQWKQLISLKSFRDLFLNLAISSIDDEGPPELSNKAHFAKGELLMFMDPEAAAKRALKVGNNFAKHNMGACLVMIETFHRGVSLYTMARRTNQRKYKGPANKIRKMIKLWWNAGNPNVKHYIKLLNAEHAALNKSYDQAEKLYVEAIALAARTGHLHHAGLFNERYADLVLYHRKDKKEAEFRLTESMRYYKEWGAIRKVEALAELLLQYKERG